MDVIHFTRGATEPLAGGARLVPLADGSGASHLGCLHLDPGSHLEFSKARHDTALLVVHGRMEVTTSAPPVKIAVHAGMGVVLSGDEAFSLACPSGAIALLLEAAGLGADPCGVSTPRRIMGQGWPTDALLRE